MHKVLNLYVVLVSVILFVGTLVISGNLRLASLVLLCFIVIEGFQYRRRLSSSLPRVAPFSPAQAVPAPASQGESVGGDYRSTPSYRKLLTACGGDGATAERLIDYEIKQDPRLSRSAATVSALDRLYIDRRHYR